jgi:phosphopantothenoylcysteine decarboxylase/phosphopantothenate--cysteine ligase
VAAAAASKFSVGSGEAARYSAVVGLEAASYSGFVARILLGVSGGISAYKAVELARLATKAGHAVRVIQTPASLNFIGRGTFEAITGAPVLVDEFGRDPARGAYPGEPPLDHDPISHLELVSRCDVYCIAPATANTIAKLAAGQADNLLNAAYLACPSPVIVAPAMNDRMYEHPATSANLDTLRGRGVHVVEPGTGALASRGEWGIGRLVEPAELLATVELAAGTGAPRPLDGMRVLVTAGGTREPLDAVRFLGNRSSGRMGFALAAEAARRGAQVTIVAANASLPLAPGITYVDVETAEEMREATLDRFGEADVLLMAAAVADFRPAQPTLGKISKDDHEALSLELVRTADVLSEAAARKRPGQSVIGFAAEHGEEAVARARSKLERKGLDAIVVNDISRSDIGFDSEQNEVTIVHDAGERRVPRATKDEVAAEVLDFVQELRTADERERQKR